MYEKEIIEYWNHPGLNSTLLGKFADDPIYVMQKQAPKGFFEQGKAFERLFQDRCTGSSLFGEKFFVCADINIPDSFIDVFTSDKPYTSQFVYTKKGEFNKTKESMRNVIFECLLDMEYFSGGKRRWPVPLSEYKQMELCVDRLMNMPIELFDGFEFKLKDIVKEYPYFFQYPLYWNCGGIEKKALFDLLVLMEHNNNPIAVGFDIKYMASLAAMHMSFKNTRSNYVIQSQHYQEALSFQEELEDFSALPQLVFLCATKTDPYLCQSFLIDDDSLDMCYSEYTKLVHECDEWIKAGKPITGTKRTIKKRIWKG